MAVFVRGHRRGRSTVKAYVRARKTGKGLSRAYDVLKAKYDRGFSALRRQGYDPKSFVRSVARRAGIQAPGGKTVGQARQEWERRLSRGY